MEAGTVLLVSSVQLNQASLKGRYCEDSHNQDFGVCRTSGRKDPRIRLQIGTSSFEVTFKRLGRLFERIVAC